MVGTEVDRIGDSSDDLTLEQDACIRGQPFGPRLDLDRSVEIQGEQDRLSFTQMGPFFGCVVLAIDTTERPLSFQQGTGNGE